MPTQRLHLVVTDTPRARTDPAALPDMRPLGELLVERDAISAADLDHALEQQRRLDAPLGDILTSDGLLDPDDLRSALADQHGLRLIDLNTDPPEPRAAHLLPATLCVKHGVVPWSQMDDILFVATARPDQFDKVIAEAPSYGLTFLPVLAAPDQINTALRNAYGSTLARQAELRVPESYSCRGWEQKMDTRLRALAWGGAAVAGLALVLPQVLMTALIAVACITMVLALGLKLAAATAQLPHEHRAALRPPPPVPAIMRLPRISVLVPLLREKEIAPTLIRRLSRLTYPKAQLEVILVLEEQDQITRDTIARTHLPPWMRVIEVPKGTGLLTKPRALNYALDFCTGSIVGIWDAEDAPMQDQIEHVVTRFHAAPPEVVCLQGRLDYYNPRANWLARCFTIEYATWWRLIMPGLERLGCVIPLGGTTLFFRRDVLSDLGGWDAHNVTEDADLGLRLARLGYRTELIDTTTYEEANCRVWPWIKQRSRWLKGFAVTWAVHMRAPRALLRDLGWYRFVMLQVFFVTALSQFTLAPVLWSFALLSLGGAHVAQSWPWLGMLIGLFLLAELTQFSLHALAVRRDEHRHLLRWTPTMMFYFPLGTAAMYKALYELVLRPFYWDKTQHGVTRAVTASLTKTGEQKPPPNG